MLPQRGKCRWIGGCGRWVEVWKQSREKKVSGEKKEDVLWEHPPFDFIIVYSDNFLLLRLSSSLFTCDSYVVCILTSTPVVNELQNHIYCMSKLSTCRECNTSQLTSCRIYLEVFIFVCSVRHNVAETSFNRLLVQSSTSSDFFGIECSSIEFNNCLTCIVFQYQILPEVFSLSLSASYRIFNQLLQSNFCILGQVRIVECFQCSTTGEICYRTSYSP